MLRKKKRKIKIKIRKKKKGSRQELKDLKKIKKKIFFRRKNVSGILAQHFNVTINPFSIPVQTMFS